MIENGKRIYETTNILKFFRGRIKWLKSNNALVKSKISLNNSFRNGWTNITDQAYHYHTKYHFIFWLSCTCLAISKLWLTFFSWLLLFQALDVAGSLASNFGNIYVWSFGSIVKFVWFFILDYRVFKALVIGCTIELKF